MSNINLHNSSRVSEIVGTTLKSRKEILFIFSQSPDKSHENNSFLLALAPSTNINHADS